MDIKKDCSAVISDFSHTLLEVKELLQVLYPKITLGNGLNFFVRTLYFG